MALARKLCVICSAPLTVHQEVRGQVCDDAQCRQKKVVHDITVAKAQRHTALLKQAKNSCEEEFPDADTTDYVFAVLPSNDSTLSPLPAERRDSFRRFLEAITAAVMNGADEAKPVGDTTKEETRTSSPKESETALSWACGVCRGRCCNLGGKNNAFIEAATITQYLRDHPHAVGTEEVVADYMQYIGDETYTNACVYQSRLGCTLPRSMRAAICGDYYCEDLETLWELLQESPNAPIYAAAVLGDSIVNAALLGDR